MKASMSSLASTWTSYVSSAMTLASRCDHCLSRCSHCWRAFSLSCPRTPCHGQLFVHPIVPVLNETRRVVKRFNRKLAKAVVVEPGIGYLDFFDSMLTSDKAEVRGCPISFHICGRADSLDCHSHPARPAAAGAGVCSRWDSFEPDIPSVPGKGHDQGVAQASRQARRRCRHGHRRINFEIIH